MKKILVLGGSDLQIPLFKKIKELGYYSISCDYLPDNVGHKFADEYHNVSILDEEKLIDLCLKLKVDAIIPYTSEIAVITCSKVCEKLNLPTNSSLSCEIMTKKSSFRIFLQENGFNYPKFKITTNYFDCLDFFKKINKKCIIKPVDSCGSRGVFSINVGEDFQNKFQISMSSSREKKVIIEEFISKKGYQIGGDGFIKEGNLEFRCFGDLHFSKNNQNLPCSVSIPSTHPKYIQEKVHKTIQDLINKVGLKMGALNFDIMVDENDEVYIIEIGARSGGNMIPELIKHSTDVDLNTYIILSALNEKFEIPKNVIEKKYYSHYVIHSIKDGVVKKIDISEKLQKCIIESYINFKLGDEVKKYSDATNRLGNLILKYNNLEELKNIIDNFHNHFIIEFDE